jgi:hypothetical protein
MDDSPMYEDVTYNPKTAFRKPGAIAYDCHEKRQTTESRTALGNFAEAT